jgi:hypothetical protein
VSLDVPEQAAGLSHTAHRHRQRRKMCDAIRDLHSRRSCRQRVAADAEAARIRAMAHGAWHAKALPVVNTSTAIFLFVVAAFVPTQRTCGQLKATVGSIFSWHAREAAVLVVNNDSPQENIDASLVTVPTQQLLVSRRQVPSRGQLGSWGVAARVLQADDAVVAQLLLKGLRPAVLHRARAAARIILMQHSTSLLRPLPTQPCPAAPLAETLPRTYSWQSYERLPGSGMALASAIAEGLGISCLEPCLNTTSEQPVGAQAIEWAVAPHAVVDMSRAAWEMLSAGLWGTAVARDAPLPAVLRCWQALDAGTVSLRELNGALERLAGVLLAWLNLNLSHDAVKCATVPAARRNGELPGCCSRARIHIREAWGSWDEFRCERSRHLQRPCVVGLRFSPSGVETVSCKRFQHLEPSM